MNMKKSNKHLLSFLFSITIIIVILSSVSYVLAVGEDRPTPLSAIVDNFDSFKEAVENGEENITISGTIECTSPINVPNANITVDGGTLIDPEFSGSGSITFDGVSFSGTITASGSVSLDIDGNASSIVASGSSEVKVNGNIVTNGDGIHARGDAVITVSGGINAGNVGIIAEGGSISVDGNVRSTSDAVQFTQLSAIKRVGSLVSQNGVMYRDMGGSGGTIPSYLPGETITVLGSGKYRVTVGDAEINFSANDSSSQFSFSVSTDKKTPPSFDLTGFEIYKSFSVTSSNCKADITYTDSYRSTADSLLLKYDSSSTTQISSGKYGGSFTVSNIENSTVALAFTTKRYTVNVTVGENGSLSPSSGTSYLEGEIVEFIASPDDEYTVDKFTINGESYSMTDGKYSCAILCDFDVEITFAKANLTHTVTIRQTVGGTVSPTGTITVKHGSSLTLTLTPDSGYYLSMIEINKVLMENSKTYTIENITEDLIVFITFKQSKTYSIVIKNTPGGTVTADDTDVYYGGSTKIRITPDEGYEVDKVISDFGTLSATNDPNVYTLKNITVATTVTVSFKRIDGNTPPKPSNGKLEVDDVAWDARPLLLELFDCTIVSGEVIEKLINDYPNTKFSIVAKDFNWHFEAGDAQKFPKGDIDFGIVVNSSTYKNKHDAFSGGNRYISVSLPEGLPTVGELKIFAGRAFAELPFYGYAFDGTNYTKVSETSCDSYYEISVPLGHREILMLCNGKPSNIVTINVEGNGTASPDATQFVSDGGSLKIIFTPAENSILSKVTVNGVEATLNGFVLELENITEDLEVVCVFLSKDSDDISRVQLPKIQNNFQIVIYVFLIVGVLCAAVYLYLRKTGKIKYKKEL